MTLPLRLCSTGLSFEQHPDNVDVKYSIDGAMLLANFSVLRWLVSDAPIVPKYRWLGMRLRKQVKCLRVTFNQSRYATFIFSSISFLIDVSLQVHVLPKRNLLSRP